MAIRFVPESNLAGAPSAPLAVEPDAGGVQAKFREVYRSLIAQGYSPEQATEVASQQSGYGDSVRSDLRKEWESRPTAATPETQPPAPPSDMAQFDVLPGDQPGTQRVWNPQTGTYETRRMPQADPRAAERAAEQQRTYDNIAENYAPGEADKWRSADERGTIHVPRTPRMIANADAARQDEYLAMEGGIGARGRIQQRTERQSQSYHPQWAREAGLDPNDPEVMAMPRGDLIAAARAKRNEGKPTPQQRENMWRVQMMMNAGNFAGAMTLAGSDPNMASVVMNQQNAALNANRGGGPLQFGPNPLGVQAAHNQQLTELGLRVATGRGFQPMTPAQEAAANAQAQSLENQLPADQQASRHAKDATVHPSEYQYADDYVARLYSGQMGWGTSSDFTIAEQQQAVDHLVQDKGYAEEKAQRIVDEIARRRNSQSLGGSSMRGAPATPPNPTGGAI